MTIATLLVALIATTAADTSGDPVLLDFHASWCGPCRKMRPEVEKLVQKGYPVKSVDIDRSPELSDRYKVKAVPTFVIIDSKGKALARTSGAMPAAQLAAFYNETKLKAAAPRPAEEAEERGKLEDVPGRRSRARRPAGQSQALGDGRPDQDAPLGLRVGLRLGHDHLQLGRGVDHPHLRPHLPGQGAATALAEELPGADLGRPLRRPVRPPRAGDARAAPRRTSPARRSTTTSPTTSA